MHSLDSALRQERQDAILAALLNGNEIPLIGLLTCSRPIVCQFKIREIYARLKRVLTGKDSN